MSQSQGVTNIVVALACEAKPLVAHYRLQKDHSVKHFSLYTSSDHTIRLLVSGVGKINMAAAVAYLQRYTNQNNSFINVGICGSRAFKLGELVLANKIIDQASNKAYYPHPLIQTLAPATTVSSFDQAQSDYPQEGVIDMEASAFFHSVSLFVAQEQGQCVKVVSDTSDEERLTVTAARVETWIHDQLAGIDAVIRGLADRLAVLRPANEGGKAFLQQWHFSEYQKNALLHQLRRWGALLPAKSPLEFCRSAGTAKAVLQRLDKHLAQLEYTW